MGIARSSFYAQPAARPDDPTIIAEIRAITDEFEGYGYLNRPGFTGEGLVQ